MCSSDAGHIVICLYVFMNDLSFPKACLTAIFFYAGIILRHDEHMASFLHAAAITGGSVLAGAITAGVAVSCHLSYPTPCQPPQPSCCLIGMAFRRAMLSKVMVYLQVTFAHLPRCWGMGAHWVSVHVWLLWDLAAGHCARFWEPRSGDSLMCGVHHLHDVSAIRACNWGDLERCKQGLSCAEL